MSLTIKHPTPEFTGEHSGLSFADGVAELAALEDEARQPLLDNGFSIEGENDVPESDEDRAAREAAEDAARDAEAKRAADEAEKAAKAAKAAQK